MPKPRLASLWSHPPRLVLGGCVKRALGRFEPSEHKMNHRDMNPGFRCFRQGFIVLGQPTTPAQPGQSAFYDRPTRQHLKVVAVRRASHDLEQPATEGTSPIYQLPSVSPVGPDQLEPRVPSRQFAQHQFGSVAVLDIGSVDDDRHSQTASQLQQYCRHHPSPMLNPTQALLEPPARPEVDLTSLD